MNTSNFFTYAFLVAFVAFFLALGSCVQKSGYHTSTPQVASMSEAEANYMDRYRACIHRVIGAVGVASTQQMKQCEKEASQ